MNTAHYTKECQEADQSPNTGSCDQLPRAASPAGGLVCGVVLSQAQDAVSGHGMIVRVSVAGQPMPVEAVVAAACLLKPETGDLVLLCLAQHATGAAAPAGGWVLSVLQRRRPTELATLTVPGGDALLLTASSLRLVAGEVEIHAGKMTMQAGILRLVGHAVDVVTRRFTQVARVYRSFADTATQHCRTRIAVVDQVDSARAGIEQRESKDVMILKGGQMLLDAKETVRMDGERILMG